MIKISKKEIEHPNHFHVWVKFSNTRSVCIAVDKGTKPPQIKPSVSILNGKNEQIVLTSERDIENLQNGLDVAKMLMNGEIGIEDSDYMPMPFVR